MKEKIYKMSESSEHIIEAVIKDDNINYMHMVLLEGEKLKTHYTNANVYMSVREGSLSLKLNDKDFVNYERNTVINIPYNTKMDAQNHSKDVLELIVIKAPSGSVNLTV